MKSVLIDVAIVRFFSNVESLVGSIRTRVSCFLLQFYYAGTDWYLIYVCLIAWHKLLVYNLVKAHMLFLQARRRYSHSDHFPIFLYNVCS